MNRLNGKIAIVTGAASGMGKATACLFAQEGAAVAICDMDVRRGEQTAAEICDAGGKAAFFPMNVCDDDQVCDVFEKIAAQFGKIDVLVNAAGIVGPAELPDEVDLGQWQKVIDIDLTGSFITGRNAIRHFRSNGGGSIVNFASISGLKATNPGTTGYHAAKGGVVNMTKNFAISYAKESIRCNCVCPGTTMTDMVLEDLKNKFDDIEEGAKVYGAMHPMGTLGDPIDTAYAVLYLASDEAKWVTGAVLSVDGGFSAC